MLRGWQHACRNLLIHYAFPSKPYQVSFQLVYGQGFDVLRTWSQCGAAVSPKKEQGKHKECSDLAV